MEKNKYIWLFIGLALIVVILITLYIFWDKLFPKDESEQGEKDKKKYEDDVQHAKDNNETPPPPPSLLDGSLPISAGDKNKKVKAMQEALIKMGASIPAGATGLFGAQTKAALTWAGYNDSKIEESDYNNILAWKKASEATTSSSTTTTTGGEVGKKVYAKSETVHIRSTPNVNDGSINNRICNLPVNFEPAPTVSDSKDQGIYIWYKIKLSNPENCENYKYGWVREDVVTLK